MAYSSKSPWRPPNPGAAAARTEGCTCDPDQNAGAAERSPRCFIVRSACPVHSFVGTDLSGGRGWTAGNAWKPGEVQKTERKELPPQLLDGATVTLSALIEYSVPSDWIA